MSYEKFSQSKRRGKDLSYMELALKVASQAKKNGDVPISAVLVWSNGFQLVEHDTRTSEKNPHNHAIINVLNKAATTTNKKVSDAVLYTTVEPNLICALALQEAGVKEVVFGAYDDKDGYMSSRLLSDHTVLDITSMGGVISQACCEVLPESMQEHVRYE